MKNKHAGVEKRQVARYLKSVALKAIPEESSDYALIGTNDSGGRWSPNADAIVGALSRAFKKFKEINR